MKIKTPLTYLDCAIAPDGGSLALLLADREQREFSLVLDHAMGSQTDGRLFYDGNGPLVPAQEQAFFDELRRLALVHADQEPASEWLEIFIEAIESRRPADGRTF